MHGAIASHYNLKPYPSVEGQGTAYRLSGAGGASCVQGAITNSFTPSRYTQKATFLSAHHFAVRSLCKTNSAFFRYIAHLISPYVGKPAGLTKRR
ncbi:hypothetical protein 3S11_47 [uncultured Caudovirales phage]|uniref:Uncharacterized protein n=1 Tax=uncultured Caudovirales phage TaxID=2100421 RepID=A0A2H4J9D3_9CAUD|nr:hypothetical protein 3S11_47 [uncultured Caudovirales phage]